MKKKSSFALVTDKIDTNTLKIFVEKGDLIFPYQQIAVAAKVGTGAQEFEHITFYGEDDGALITDVELRPFPDSEGCSYLLDYIPMTEALAQGLINLETDFDKFVVNFVAPFTAKYHIDQELGIVYARKENYEEWLTCFEVISWEIEPDVDGNFLKEGDIIAQIISEGWHRRYERQIEKKRERDALEDVKFQEREIREKIVKLAYEVDNAQNRIKDLEKFEKEKIRDAEIDAQRIINHAKNNSAKLLEEAGDEIKARMKATDAEARAKEEAILESARQRRREALETRDAAEAEVAQIIEIAKQEAETTVAKADREAENKLKQIDDDAAKLNFAAIIARLSVLRANGELPELTDRPALRQLYISLGELLADTQGYAAPETQSQMVSQNRMDEIVAMNAALARQIKEIDESDWAEEVKDRAKEQLWDMAEAKGGSILKGVVGDG